MKRFSKIALLAAVVATLMALAGLASANDGTLAETSVDDPTYIGEPPPCDAADAATLSVVDCTGSEPVASLDEGTGVQEASALPANAVGLPQPDPGLPANCRIHLEAVFYTETDWVRLGQQLAADPSPCADYYISIPPVSNDKTRFRTVNGAASIDSLGPRFHAVAEINLTAATGWGAWVRNNNKTWTDAGLEARRRMAAAGYDLASGDTWALNELSTAVRRDTGPARANIEDLARALHDGDGSMPTSKGIAFVVGLGQNLADAGTYKATMERWLQDDTFWREMARDVHWWAQEVYPNSRNWGVVGAPRATRAEYFNDYLQHPLTLAEAGPASVATARSFLEQSYTPLMSAAWRWQSNFGETDISEQQMNNFVSEEIFSMRHYAGSHPQTIPQGSFGAAWAPQNLEGLSKQEFADQTRGILQRLASALHHSYQQGGSAQEGACGPPGEHVWCDGDVDGAAFNDAWKTFAEWSPLE
jgi:hypothetical protein